MDGMDLNNAPIFKLERNDTTVSNADLILPSDVLSAFIQENNSSFSEKFDNKIISEILCSNHGDEQQFVSSETVWDNIDNLVGKDDSNTMQHCSQFANKRIYLIPSKKADVFQEDGNQFAVESSSDTVQNINNLEEFLPLKKGSSLFIEPDTNALATANPSLSLQSWAGKLNFSLNLKTREHNNKWCYSEDLGILFSSMNTAVPIEVTVDNWLDGAYINITPVFTDGECRLVPVPRCYNHAQNDASGWADHIVQVENMEAVYYKSCKERHTIDIPIGVPPPGETTMQVLVKVGCWNTCVGGPCRKPFCLVFTLFSRNHEEIGRQIINLKICSCPKRDMDNTLKSAFQKEGFPIPQSVIRKKNSPTKKLKTKLMLQNKKIKLEQSEIPLANKFALYEHLVVPSRFKPQIEEYIKMLLAKEHAQKYYPDVLAYKG